MHIKVLVITPSEWEYELLFPCLWIFYHCVSPWFCWFAEPNPTCTCRLGSQVNPHLVFKSLGFSLWSAQRELEPLSQEGRTLSFPPLSTLSYTSWHKANMLKIESPWNQNNGRIPLYKRFDILFFFLWNQGTLPATRLQPMISTTEPMRLMRLNPHQFTTTGHAADTCLLTLLWLCYFSYLFALGYVALVLNHSYWSFLLFYIPLSNYWSLVNYLLYATSQSDLPISNFFSMLFNPCSLWGTSLIQLLSSRKDPLHLLSKVGTSCFSLPGLFIELKCCYFTWKTTCAPF